MSKNKIDTVKYIVMKHLFDGKCVSTIVENRATSRYPICFKTTHQFGVSEDNLAPNKSSLKYILGLLHSEI